MGDDRPHAEREKDGEEEEREQTAQSVVKDMGHSRAGGPQKLLQSKDRGVKITQGFNRVG